MALTNFASAIVLARNFDEKYFATYLSIAALWAIISIPMQSIQNAYAIQSAQPNSTNTTQTIHFRGMSVKTLSVFLISIWILSIPILYYYSKIELSALVSSSALFFVLFPCTIISGKLRKLEKFGKWRFLLAVTSMSQIPVVCFAAYFHLDLWIYLLMLCIPSLLYIAFSLTIVKSQLDSEKHQIFVRWTSLLYSLIGSYSLQLPLIFSVKLLREPELGSLLVFYLFSITISLGSLFGTFFVPVFVKGAYSPSFFSKFNLIFCIPSICLGLMLLSPIKKLFPLLFGQNYEISFNGGFAWLFLLSSVLWSIYSSHVQIRLGSVSIRTVVGGLLVLIFEWLFLIFFVNSFNEIVLVHFFTSIIQLQIINIENFKHSSKSTDQRPLS